jgi:hypothetical protein
MQVDPILHTTLENSPHITNKNIYSCKTDPKFYFSHPILSSSQIGSVIMGGKEGKKYKICIFDPTMDILLGNMGIFGFLCGHPQHPSGPSKYS